MITLIQDQLEALQVLCAKHAVARLDVFGSGANGGFDSAQSDLDFLVEFKRSDTIGAADQYFGLLEGLESLFGRRVDLVCANSMRNPYFIERVEATREKLYAA